MSNSYSNSLLNKFINKTPSEIASDIFQGTAVESAYDKKGRFSHLLARLTPPEFVRLYSPQTTASVFIQGYWLQLCLKGAKKRVINRETKGEMSIEIGVNEYGITELSFFRFEKLVFRFKLKHITAADLLNTERGYHYIARAAVRAFAKVHPGPAIHSLAMSYMPVVLVLMKNDKPSTASGFNAQCVCLQ